MLAMSTVRPAALGHKLHHDDDDDDDVRWKPVILQLYKRLPDSKSMPHFHRRIRNGNVSSQSQAQLSPPPHQPLRLRSPTSVDTPPNDSQVLSAVQQAFRDPENRGNSEPVGRGGQSREHLRRPGGCCRALLQPVNRLLFFCGALTKLKIVASR